LDILFEVASDLPDEVPPELNEVFLIILYEVKNEIDELLEELNRVINLRRQRGPQ